MKMFWIHYGTQDSVFDDNAVHVEISKMGVGQLKVEKNDPKREKKNQCETPLFDCSN